MIMAIVRIKLSQALLFCVSACSIILCCSTFKYIVDNQSFIDFSGYTWEIKEQISEPTGPRANYWSAENVCVRRNSYIELTISNKNDQWYASEVRLSKALGYGTYKFKVSSSLNKLDKHTVLGLFLYANDNQEIDIEIQSHVDLLIKIMPLIRSKP